MKTESATITMELTADFAPGFIEKMNIEIEVLQGEKELMPDGRTRYKFTVNDELKKDMLREFCLKMISHSHKANGN